MLFNVHGLECFCLATPESADIMAHKFVTTLQSGSEMYYKKKCEKIRWHPFIPKICIIKYERQLCAQTGFSMF